MTKPKPYRKTAKKLPATEPEPENGFDPETDDDLEQFFSGQSESAVVSIYRVGKAGERDGFLDMMTISALMNPGHEQVCRDAYGPGHYKLKLRVPDGRGGKMVYGGSKTITIAERPGVVAPSGNGNGRGHSGPDDFWREESNKQQQLILALIGAQKPQTIDFAGLAAMMTALSGGNKQSDLGAVVAAFTALKQSAEPPDTVTTMQKALELARTLNGAPAAGASGEETDTGGWPGIIKGALSAFTNAGRAAQQQPMRQALPPARNDAELEPQEDEEEIMLQQWLAGQLGFLKSKALTGKPVEFWIQYTIDNADEAGNQAIFTALKGGATFEQLLAFDTEIAQNAALRLWFQKFYDGLKRSLHPAQPIPWIVGNKPDPTGNEAVSTPGQPAAGSAPGSGNAGQP